MNKSTFESHNLSNKRIPFVFHRDEHDITACVPNWHNNIEILYFTRGKGTAIIDSESIPVSPHDIIFINSNNIHTVYSNTSVAYCCLIVDSDFCTENGINVTETDYKTLIRSEEAEVLFKKVINELDNDYQFKEAGCKSAVLELMVYLSRNFILNEKASAEKKSNENIRLAIGYIRSHINDQLTIEEIANETGLSKYHFAREFKKITGFTVISYINTLRCRKAQKLLAKNEFPIHEIALKCGFENNSYFSKTFKKHTGFLPSEYIKKQDNVITPQFQ